MRAIRLFLISSEHILAYEDTLSSGLLAQVYGVAWHLFNLDLHVHKVIGVAGGADKCQLLLERGAFAAVDYSRDDLKVKVMALTNKRGADVVVDMVGGSTMDQCVKWLVIGREFVKLYAIG